MNIPLLVVFSRVDPRGAIDATARKVSPIQTPSSDYKLMREPTSLLEFMRETHSCGDILIWCENEAAILWCLRLFCWATRSIRDSKDGCTYWIIKL
jgi:hypothetical protein